MGYRFATSEMSNWEFPSKGDIPLFLKRKIAFSIFDWLLILRELFLHVRCSCNFSLTSLTLMSRVHGFQHFSPVNAMPAVEDSQPLADSSKHC